MALTPTLSAIKAAIALEIKTAMNPTNPNVVTSVHGYRRWWKDKFKFEQLFKRPSDDLNPGLINGWMISRFRTTEIETEERWRFYDLHRFNLHGYAGVQDSGFTEESFQNQIEAIRDRLRLSTAIFGNMERTAPVSNVEVFDKQDLAEATVWYCMISLVVEAIETKSL